MPTLHEADAVYLGGGSVSQAPSIRYWNDTPDAAMPEGVHAGYAWVINGTLYVSCAGASGADERQWAATVAPKVTLSISEEGTERYRGEVLTVVPGPPNTQVGPGISTRESLAITLNPPPSPSIVSAWTEVTISTSTSGMVAAVYLGDTKVWPFAPPPPITLPFTGQWDAGGLGEDPGPGQWQRYSGSWYVHSQTATGVNTSPTGDVRDSPLHHARSVDIEGVHFAVGQMTELYGTVYVLRTNPLASSQFDGRRVSITWNANP